MRRTLKSSLRSLIPIHHHCVLRKTLKSRFPDLKFSDPSPRQESMINGLFFLGHVGAHRASLSSVSTPECRGNVCGDHGDCCRSISERFRARARLLMTRQRVRGRLKPQAASWSRIPPHAGPKREYWKFSKDFVIWRRAAPTGLTELPKVLLVIRGRARARKPSDIER